MTLHPDTLTFFAELERNNNREWFMANKERWDAIRASFEQFTEAVIERVSALDPSIGHPRAKSCMYRIYRDLRFSPDKRPYKCHISFFLATGGVKRSGLPGYYMQVGQEDYGLEGNITLGGGIFMPTPEALAAIRQEIFYSVEEFKAIMAEPNYQRYFGNTFFTVQKVSRVPKGYPADWPDADLLKYKDYCTMGQIAPQEVGSPTLIDQVTEVFAASVPLNRFIHKAMYELLPE